MARKSLKQRFWRIGIALAVLLVIVIVARNLMIGWAPSRSEFPVQGITVSEANGEIAWNTVGATGVDFAYLHATRGTDARDAAFAANRVGARNAGIRHGAVHQYSLCQLATDQATNFITTVPGEDNLLPPAVRLSFDDCDERPGRALLLSELTTFLNQIEAHSGKPAVLAITAEFEELYAVSAGIDRTVWLEQNFFPPDYATKPWVMWQASDMRRTSGIDGPVDWNVVRP